MEFTNEQKHKAALREIMQRRRVYPRLVGKGSMTQKQMDYEIAVMTEIAGEYRERMDADSPQLFGLGR